MNKYLAPQLVHQVRKIYFLQKLKRQEIFEDEKDLLIVSKLIKPDYIVIDVGANIGLYTVFISRLLSDSGRVLSFEPIPETYDILKNNVANLCRRNTKVFQLALYDHSGSIDMVVPKDPDDIENFYLSYILPNDALCGNDRVLRIQAETLDSVLSKYRLRTDFIKIDVEGAELRVFYGARRSIKQHLPHIMCEISRGHERYGHASQQIFTYLWDHGYRSYIARNEKLVTCSGGVKGFPNYFFIHSKKVQSISAILNIE